MKTFYSEYVHHCMRFYVRHPHPVFRTDVDKLNWKSCAYALEAFEDKEKELLVAIFIENDTIANNVYKVSNEHSIDQDFLWKLISDLERRVAKWRGLR